MYKHDNSHCIYIFVCLKQDVYTCTGIKLFVLILTLPAAFSRLSWSPACSALQFSCCIYMCGCIESKC